MHMADALVSPAVGISLWAAGSAVTCYSARQSGKELSEQKIPLMGVMGAFVFAVQMINFAIPGTGSSGHLGGGMLLAVLLGSHAGFLVMTSILMIQALLFADGGLLALGCNVINLAFFPCYIAYPLIYQPIVGKNPTKLRLTMGVTLAAVIGLQLGAAGVVLETVFSGITELPVQTFALFMLPIHLAIGLMEAAVTTAVLLYIWREMPELLKLESTTTRLKTRSLKRLTVAIMIAAVLISGALSWFASEQPDGLEWSILQTTGHDELHNSSWLHETLAQWQQKIALFADYQAELPFLNGKKTSDALDKAAKPPVDLNTSTAGVVGAVVILLLVGIIGVGCQRLSKRNVN
jgi:cobalt/nickel transport system permease protein